MQDPECLACEKQENLVEEGGECEAGLKQQQQNLNNF